MALDKKMDDRFEMLHPAEREKAVKWMDKHRQGCADAEFITTSSVAGYGFRMKVICQRCGTREDVTEEKRRDPGAHR
jgi:hypothetical protein